MDADFWHQRWNKGELGFHEARANALLVAHADDLALSSGARAFLPLCGKTRDIAWLLDRGLCVAGAELSAKAVSDLFTDLGIEPTVSQTGTLTRHEADGIDIYQGDIFDLTANTLGPVDAVYDRAALVALPDGVRDRYAAHLTALTGAAPQALICFEYDQAALDGPPFSVTADEVRRHYAKRFAIDEIARKPVKGGLKGVVEADEILWRLTPR